jgi:hypothetical protein
MGGPGNQASDEDSNDNSDYSDVSPRNNGRNRRSMYYDPHNDNFDRESDEDFIVDSSPERVGTRRTLRRLDQSEDINMQARSRRRNLNEQREARNRRFRQRNRVRNEDSEDDPEDYVFDEVQSEESKEEYHLANRSNRNKNPSQQEKDHKYSSQNSDDYNIPIEEESEEELHMMNNFDRQREYGLKKPVNRNGILDRKNRRNVIDSDSDDEMLESQPVNKTLQNEYNPMLGITKITIEEEEKGTETPFRSFSHFLSIHNNENFDFTSEIKGDAYKIDKEKALEMKDHDKYLLNCAL